MTNLYKMDELVTRKGQQQGRDLWINIDIPVLCQDLGPSDDLDLAYDDGVFPGSRREIVAPRSAFKTEAARNAEARSGFERVFQVQAFCGTGWCGCCRVHGIRRGMSPSESIE